MGCLVGKYGAGRAAAIACLLIWPHMAAAQEGEPPAPDYTQPGYSTTIQGEGIDPIPLNRAQSDRMAMSLAARYASDGRFAEAVDILASLYSRRPNDRELETLLSRVEQAWGQKLMSGGRFAEARQMLTTAAERRPEDRDIQILLAQAEVATGEPKAAISRLEALARKHPDWPRPRVELALAHAAAGNIRTAKSILIAELGKDPPPHVRRNLEAAIRDLEDKQTFVGRFNAGVAPDSNITGGTYNNTIEYLGLPFTLNDDAKQQSGVRGSISTGGTLRTDWRDNTRLEFSADVAHTEPLGNKGTPSSNAKLSMAARMRSQKGNGRVGMAVQPFYWDNALQRIERSVFVEAGRQVVGPHSLVGSVTLSEGDYNNDDLHDFRQWETSFGPSLALGQDTRLQINGVFGVRNAENDLYSFIRRGGSINLMTRPTPAWRVSAAVALTRDVYDDYSIPFGATQEDLVSAANLEVVKNDWVFFGLSPSLSLGYSEVRSSIDLYDKRSVTFNLGFSLPY